jgi:Ca2+-binding EF-hand superfamily protein
MFMFAFLLVLPALALAQDAAHLEALLQSLLDGNKDGKISVAEAEAYFLTYDANKDSEITLAEFTTSVDKVDPQLVGHEHTLFTLFDRDSNGKVNKADIDAAFHLADLNRDNYINKSELHLIVALAGTHVG